MEAFLFELSITEERIYPQPGITNFVVLHNSLYEKPFFRQDFSRSISNGAVFAVMMRLSSVCTAMSTINLQAVVAIPDLHTFQNV
ncbi:MAG: hypothetical protein IPL23_10555 [Saprospiraceae bacterium]|nr:hypothetical protein [Saprospiraceae bacterium]